AGGPRESAGGGQADGAGIASLAVRHPQPADRHRLRVRVHRTRADAPRAGRGALRRARACGYAAGRHPRSLPYRRRDEEPLSLESVKAVVDASAGTLFTACVVRLERKGRFETYATGTLCPDPSAPPDAPCTNDAIFDLASLTKLATTALLL